VDNPWPSLLADSREIRTVVQDSVNQRPSRMTGGGMHDEPCRLIQDQKVGIFIQDVEGNRFGDEGRRLRRRD
jgi:hypothetical protein